MRIGRTWQLVGGAYVASLMALTGFATADNNHFVAWAWITALVLTIPTLLALIPLIYLVIPVVWALTDIDHGGPTWPTTLAYVACVGAAAAANVLFVNWLVSRRRARRRGAGLPEPSGSAMPTA